MLRRVAVHHLQFVETPGVLRYQVLEIEDGKYVRHYPLEGEPAMTEWLGGKAIVYKDKTVRLEPIAI